MKIILRFLFLLLFSFAFIVGCKSENSDFAILDDTQDTAENDTNIDEVEIISFSPTLNPVKVTSTTDTTFVVAVNGTSGQVEYTWKLNGSLLVQGPEPYIDMNGGSLNPGVNALEVIAANEISQDSKIFNVEKNTAPNIDSTSPSAAGNNVTCSSGSLVFTVNATDPDNDGMTYSWRLNGAPHNATFSVLSGTNSSQNTFSPLCSLAGANTVSVVVDDGYETTTASWSVTVINPLVAQIIGQTPVGSPIVIQEGGNQNFTVSASGQAPFDYTWGINADPPVSSGTTPNYTVSAASFPVPNGTTILGDNTFTATVEDNNSTSDSYTWNVKINSAPAVSNPTPASSFLKMNYLS
ncbi:MAG: hypothetical protein KDD40_10570, partial [Bdellovibrionales bacterium]|nr:hypothetical protein [Bdellovibrionales bacterium]